MKGKIHRGDEVIVLTGRDKGKRGKIKNILPVGKAIVAGVNLVSKHQKPAPNVNHQGGILKKEAAINLSNLAIFNKILGKADRVGFKITQDKKVRIFKSNGEIIK